MDTDFTPAERAFETQVEAFLAAELPQRLRDAARATPSVFVEPDIGLEWQRILNLRGWAAPYWPKDAGGPGWSATERYLFERACARAGAPALSVLGLKLVGPIIARYGTAEQRARFLPRILTAEDQWCQGYSEPGAGSDLASLKTRAVRDGDRYIVNGSKIWTTHAHYADWMFCLARTDPDVKPQAGISFLLLRMDQPGVTVRPIIGLAGDHEVNQVFLDDVDALVADRIGDEGQGWEIAKSLLETERGGSAHAPHILADIARLKSEVADAPSGLNGALGHSPEWTRRLARLELDAQALETTELRILADLAAGRPAGPQTSLTKLIAASLRQRVAEAGVEAHGYLGLQLPPERPLYGNEAPEPVESKAAQLAMPGYLNSRAWSIFGGTDEVQKTIIAKTVLGL